MAMNELQSELLRLLTLGTKNQDSIIKRIDSLVTNHGLNQVKKWRNLSNKKNTFLHELVERDLSDVIRYVVQRYELDLNIKRDSDGVTPLQLATELQDSRMCGLLKDLGAHEILTEDVSQWSPDEDKLRAMNIVWLDLEMTSIEKPEIMECAVIITDKDLKELERKNWVIHFDQDVLDGLEEWHQKTFADKEQGGNGLFADVLESRLTKDQVEEELLDLLKRHCTEKKCPLGGSSVHIDKEVLKLRMKRVHDFLHYRIIDVSSFQGIMRRWAPWVETHIKHELLKKGQETVNHRAMDDIEWSIAFMGGFRPMLPKAHKLNNRNQEPPPSNNRRDDPRTNNRKKDSPMNQRRRRSVSPSLVARNQPFIRNQPFVRNNSITENKIQLYADEKRLLERIKLDKSLDGRSLGLDKENLQKYNANPHLREVFLNNQYLTVYNKDFTIENRRLKLSSSGIYNNNNSSPYEKQSTTEHWGQRKLLLVEIEFLTTYATNYDYLVVYAGAAPGSHINYLSRLFPHLLFDLIDTNDFAVEKNKQVEIRPQKFTDDVARRYGTKDRKILFICNVRTFNPQGNADKDLIDDMTDQLEWLKMMKPHASLLNFRLPITPKKMKYLHGELVIEPWASKRATECRLIVVGEPILIEYDLLQFENSLSHFHNDKRIRYYKHDMDEVKPEGLDHCYDCRAEIFILQEYINKTRKVKSTTELKNWTAQMSSEISREIVDERREACLGFIRTLDVIRKK